MKFPIPLHALESLLSQCLVEHNGYGVGQVQAARALDHRDADAAVVDLLQQVFRQAARLAAKDEKITILIRRLVIAARRLCARKVHPRIRMLAEKFAEVWVSVVGHQIPIVQPGALQVFVAQRKAQRLNQMQRCACRGAGARDIARVLRDFRVEQHDVHHLSLIHI